MNKDIDPRDQDDVVVIEERDNKTLVYIAVAAVFGVAIGGLIGSIVTENKWQSSYQSLEVLLEKTKQINSEVVIQKEQAADKKAADMENEIIRRVAHQTEDLFTTTKKEVEKSQSMVIELEKVNSEFEKQIQSQSDEITKQESAIAELEQQIAIQTGVFERSRELFQRELLIKQDLERLQKERDTLEPRLKRYKKECDIYLDGTSFDASSSACDKHDEINSNVSQIDQMIEVHKLDLREIESIANNIGL